MSSDIKIIRLVTGEDIISHVEFPNKKEVTVINPITFYTDFEDTETGEVQSTMKFWLPMNEIKPNFVNIDRTKIMFIIDPSDEFIDKYQSVLDSIYDSSEIDTVSNQQMLLESEIPKQRILH